MAGHSYTATISWRRDDGDFAKGRYSRGHVWRFDGGVEVPATASPQVVPRPFTVDAAVDPEEALVASLSSCHMLTFIDMARRGGFVVDAYDDAAEGVMEKNEAGRMWVSDVTLAPRIVFSGPAPAPDELARLHEAAHDACFISNSVRTRVTVAPPATG
jgi:organic hydroperoxide reductase OsmC/OhrA